MSGLTQQEVLEIRVAYERDRWAGEWNSLPTAIDRVLAAREDGWANDCRASHFTEQQIRDARADGLKTLSAELYRDHDMPPNKDRRSYGYRDGWWDGVHHAAKVAERRAREVAA